MTVSEARAAFSDGAGFAGGALVGFDMSAGQVLSPEEFTAAVSGVSSLELDFSQRTVIRRYVDGYKAVPVSDMRCIKLTIWFIAGDAVHRFLVNAAENSDIVRFAYADSAGEEVRIGFGVVRRTGIRQNSFGRLEMDFVIENG